jgi:uncharacterized membrane protein YjjP (DUF1212 family)
MRIPILIWALAAVLIAYGSYTVWLVTVYDSLWFLAWSIPCFLGGIGMILRRAWSQYLFYVVATCTAGGWAINVGMLAFSGWPYRDAQSTVISLVPGLLLVAFCISASIHIRRYFKANAREI